MAERKSIDAPPEPSETQRVAISACLRGKATGAQAATAMAFILNDMCGIGALEPANLNEAQAGFTRGRRWVGIHIARLGRLALWSPQEDEDE